METRDRELLAHYKSVIRYRRTRSECAGAEDLPAAVPPLCVVEYEPAHDSDCWVYATLGMSGRPMPVPAGAPLQAADHRVELIVYADRRRTELINVLLNLACFPFKRRVHLRPGDVLTGPPVPVLSGSVMTDFYVSAFATDRVPHAGHVRHSDGTTTEILLVTPIHGAEKRLAKAAGGTALEHRFTESGVDVADFGRAPVA